MVLLLQCLFGPVLAKGGFSAKYQKKASGTCQCLPEPCARPNLDRQANPSQRPEMRSWELLRTNYEQHLDM